MVKLFIDLIVAILPAVIIVGIFAWFLKNHGKNHQNFQLKYLDAMKAQNENLERIAKALEQKNGTDVK